MDAIVEQQDAELKRLVDAAVGYAAEVSPITYEMARQAPTWRAAYSDRTAALMATFCELAYDRFEESIGVTRQVLEAKLARGRFALVATYDVDATTEGYLAASDQFAVLAFRGTQDAADWRVNFNAGLEQLDPARPRIKVHTGFLEAFRSVEPLIRADLDAKVGPDIGLYITGHSLGGALAQIASAALERPTLAACYTFGSPRVGGADFDFEVKCPNYRLVNDWDLVPAVPPPGWRGYHHAGDVRQLTARGRPPYRGARSPWRFLLRVPWALIVYAVARRFFLIDDHMIWNYRDKLAVVARNRNRGLPKDATPAASSTTWPYSISAHPREGGDPGVLGR
ncbi:MAG: lipase family protein [Caulobacteraceae bacterium]